MAAGVRAFMKTKFAQIIARVSTSIPGRVKPIFFEKPVMKGATSLPNIINISSMVERTPVLKFAWNEHMYGTIKKK
jgi:hypothetical protein